MEILAKDSKGKVTDWEEVPDEDLWQDGELKLDSEDIKNIIYLKVVTIGEWKLIREVK